MFDELWNSVRVLDSGQGKRGLRGKLKRLNDQEVGESTVEIENEEKIVSDDPHVLAVATDWQRSSAVLQ